MVDEMMGGVMGLEFPVVGNFPFTESRSCIFVNSGRAALQLLLQNREERPRRVLVPRFVCDTVLQPMKRLSIPVERYHCNDQLRPELPEDLREDDVLLLVNYFGFTGRAVEEAARQHRGTSIVDATTALFSQTQLPCFYSPRKFCGLADGGVACDSRDFSIYPNDTDSSAVKSLFLLERLETGFSLASHLCELAEQDLNTEPRDMSPVTRSLIDAYDFDTIRHRRLENYAALHRLLGGINRLELPEHAPAAPMCYPLVSGIPDLRDSLIDAGVALPLFWPEVIKATTAESVENRLARTLVPLPLDQRYTPGDMEHLASLVLGK